MDGWIDGYEGMDGRMWVLDGWVDEWVKGGRDEGMDSWEDGWNVVGWVDG